MATNQTVLLVFLKTFSFITQTFCGYLPTYTQLPVTSNQLLTINYKLHLTFYYLPIPKK